MTEMERRGDHAGKPPQIVTVEEQLARMRVGTKETYEIRLRDFVIPVRVLSVDEVNAIRREAIRFATVNGGDETDRNLSRQKSTLALASTLNKGSAPILHEKILGAMTTDELGHLYDEYVRVLDAVNPSMDSMSAEQFRELVDALKKSTVTARDCSLLQLREICTAFVDLIQRLETQKSQQGS